MFNDTSSTLALLNTRRSGKPRDMIEPGPNTGQLRTILEAAIRVPDHGKLNPWRFVIIGNDLRDRLADLLISAYRAEKPDAGRLEIEAMDQFARQAPTLVVALSTPFAGSKIPLWEQELSVGAACMNLLTAAHASGFVGSWLTGWPTYSNAVRDAFGGPDDRIAGFLFIGSPSRGLEERPRPDYDSVVKNWG
jgi:nitroreductase